MGNVLGIDPGSLSWDFFGIDDKLKIILDTSIPTKLVIQEPRKAVDIIKSVKNLELIVAPSGFGLPLKKVKDMTEEDIFYTLLKFKKEEKDKLLGLGAVLRLIKEENIPGVIVPGVKHLTTIPRYRKVNKIDMGTADKLCTAVVGIKDQIDTYKITPAESKFIMAEIGYGFTAVLAIENGQVVDGIGGSNIMGFRACGSLDGELAYLVRNISKSTIYKGGVSFISGFSDLSIKEIVLLAQNDVQTRVALEAYISSVQKSVYAISSSIKGELKEILLAGRGVNVQPLRKKMIEALNGLASVRSMKSYSHISKRAAQGAAFIANGLIGGEFEAIVQNLKIKQANGTILDDIYIPFDKTFMK